MLLATLLLALSLANDVHLDEVHGFRIEVPDGWTRTERELGEEFTLSLLPPGSIGELGVSVTVLALEKGATVEALLELARAKVEEGGEAFPEYEEWETEIAGRSAPGVRAVFRAPAGEFRIVQSYLVEGGHGWLLQRHAPVDDWEERARELEAVAATFAFAEITDEGLAERRIDRLVARCGSEVEWADDWEGASERAREEGRLVLVVASLLSGFSIADNPRTALFTDEDVIELVGERFVPLWYERGMTGAFVDAYGLSPTAFGQALVLATPDGEVVLQTREAMSVEVAYPFLREGLARHPEVPGRPVPADLAPLERARRMVARGELEPAQELLDGRGSAGAHRLRARILRLLRRGPEALEALAAAREAGDPDEAGRLVEEADLLIRGGLVDEAARALDRVLAEHAGTEEAARAALIRGLVEWIEGDPGSAKRRWRELALERPESRWAWQAAAALRSTVLDLGVRPDLGWPDEAVIADLLAFPDPAPLPPERDAEAARIALEWLLAAQRPDGSWLCPTELSTVPEMGPDPFVDSICALGLRALLRHGEEEAAGRALEFLLASIARRERTPPMVFYMDYMTWSDAMMLGALADGLEAGLADEERLRRAASALVADLAGRQVRDGGWSYYVTNDLGGAGVPAQTISFTTAGAILGLVRAREVGFPVPDAVLDTAVSALERMRDEDGVFAYFLYRDADEVTRVTAAPGAVGRGPACELALLRAGRSAPDRLLGALELFLEQAPLYSAEQGKVVMHAGPHGQGCHYLLFDYAHAALAQSALPADRRIRARILELVLDCRQADGSFLDTPILGHPYGTAMALIALDALAEEEGE